MSTERISKEGERASDDVAQRAVASSAPRDGDDGVSESHVWSADNQSPQWRSNLGDQAIASDNSPGAESGASASSVSPGGAENATKKKHKKKRTLKLEIAHRTPGRVRMKIPSAKGDSELLREIAETFGVIPGIERVAVNPTTGSVVLHYDTDHHSAFNDRLATRLRAEDVSHPSTEIDDLARKIQSEAEFLAGHSEGAKAIVDFFKGLDREIKVASNNCVDLKIVLAVGIIGLTVFEVGASAATPVWLTLTVFTLNHFIDLHHQPMERAPVIFKPA
ncbi:HMA2 domain-containing protein [Methylocapsa aurea]|uniref:HMA2 domain-containing protein n=1 Tax=Methylocapsa aurea TaxID=663610 RepID=UPI003D18FC2B